METKCPLHFMKIFGYAKIMNKRTINTNQFKGNTHCDTELSILSGGNLKQERRQSLPILKVYRDYQGLGQKEKSTGQHKGQFSNCYRIAKPALSLKEKSVKIEQVKKGIKRKANSEVPSTSKAMQPSQEVSTHQKFEHDIKGSLGSIDSEKHGNLTQKDYCEEILKALWRKKDATNASPFFEPFDIKAPELRDYHKIIKQPMNFESVEAKLRNGSYKGQEEFADDVRLVFTNCYRYYPAHHSKIKMAQDLQEVFEIKYAQMPASSIFQLPMPFKENSSDSSLNAATDVSEDDRESPRLKLLQEQLKVAAKSLSDLEIEMREKRKRRELNKRRKASIRNRYALAETPLFSKVLKGRELKNHIALNEQRGKYKLSPPTLGIVNEDYRAMSYDEMKELSSEIGKLKGDDLFKLADIVRSNDSFFDDSDPENVELNLAILKPSTLWLLDEHVKSCSKKMAKKRCKSPTSSNAISYPLSSTNCNAINQLNNSNFGPSLSSSDSEGDNELEKTATKEQQNSNPIPYHSTSPYATSHMASFIRPPLMAMHNLPAQVEKPAMITTCKKETAFQPIRHDLLNGTDYSTTQEVRQQRESPISEVFQRKIESQLRKSWPWSNLTQVDTPRTCIPNTVRESVTYSTFQHFKKMAREKSEMNQANNCSGKEPPHEGQSNKSEASGITSREISPRLQEEKQSSPIISTPESLSPSSFAELSDSFSVSPLSESRERQKMLEQEKRYRETNEHSTDILRQGEILEEFEKANDISYLKVKKWQSP